MKRSLYLRLFLTFYAVLFLALAVITTSFVYVSQKAENDQQVQEMMAQARSLARSTYDYRIGAISQKAYNRLVGEFGDERTAIWIVDQMGLFVFATGIQSGQRQLTVDDIKNTFATVVLDRQELTMTGKFDSLFEKRMNTVATPIIGGDISFGAVYLHRQYDPISLDMLDNMLLAIAGIAFVLSALPMLLVVNSVTKPLKEMAGVSKRYAGGDFTCRVKSYKIREIDQLASSLNKMAEDLAKLDQLRIGFVANVSHELRSPLTACTAIFRACSTTQYLLRITASTLRWFPRRPSAWPVLSRIF